MIYVRAKIRRSGSDVKGISAVSRLRSTPGIWGKGVDKGSNIQRSLSLHTPEEGDNIIPAICVN